MSENCRWAWVAGILLLGACSRVAKLPPGSPCAPGNSGGKVCASGVCGSHHCCTAACASTDSACASIDCDTSGACIYSGTPCGPPPGCDDGGGTLGLSSACCRSSLECSPDHYCAGGACVAREDAGANCIGTPTSAPGEACLSNICRGQHCCGEKCSTGDPLCHVSGCDSTGACVYPDSATVCGPPESCVNGMHTVASGCGADGGCAIASAASCGAYRCEPAGIGCTTSCGVSAQECAAGAYCGNGKCALRGGPGQACAASATNTADQACLSGICLGNCCTTACSPDPTTNCQGACDSAGACTLKSCPNNFGCSGGSECNTTCATNADCSTLGFCDPVGATACCTRFATGDKIYVDGTAGDDTTPCCGAQTTPCQTMTHAMTMVVASATSGTILEVANDDGTTSWTASETYPIHLGWGVTLDAPSMYFANQAQASDIFWVYAYGATDTDTVTIQGGNDRTLDDAVHIGFDGTGQLASYLAAWNNARVGVNDDIRGEVALPLVLNEVWIDAHQEPNPDESYDLKVGAGAVVTLGPGPVEMGNGPLTGFFQPVGGHAIYCKGAGAIIKDDPTSTGPVLTADYRSAEYLDIEDGCSVTLTQGPRLGALTTSSPPGWDNTVSSCKSSGFGFCKNSCDLRAASGEMVEAIATNGAIVVVGSGSVAFGSVAMPGAIYCATNGVTAMVSNASGSPTVALNGATIDLIQYHTCDGIDYKSWYCFTRGLACTGALINEGTFSAAATTFTHGWTGVFLGPNVISADLSGGTIGGNTFACNSSDWGTTQTQNGPLYCSSPWRPRPASLVNASGVAVNAENATWPDWDSTSNSTEVLTCTDTTYSTCSCDGPGCPHWAYYGGVVDAVTLTTNSLDTSAGTQGSAACQ